MYYNIKIKINNAEFILKSLDKKIIQKEMDIYFAYFLGKDYDCISKQNKTVLEEKFINENKQQNISQTPIKITPLNEQNPKNTQEVHPLEYSNDKILKELISYAKSIHEIKAMSDNVVNILNDESNVPQQNNAQTKDNSDTALNSDENSIAVKNEGGINSSVTPVLTASANEDIKFFDDKNNALDFEKTSLPQADEIRIKFKDYIAKYDPKTTEEKFMICAYYMRNVLYERDFSLKTLNTQLYPATGDIADTSLVDEMTAKEYIKITDNNGTKKYEITARGEGYFLSRFKG